MKKLVAATTLVLMTLPLHANILLPGDTNVSPDVFTLSGNPPLLGDTTGTFNFGNGALTGSWESIVAVDPFGVTCAGCLDFAFAISLDSGLPNAAIFALGLSRYFGYTTDVGYVANSGAVAPVTVSRGPFGGGIFFNLPTSILPGNPVLTSGQDTVAFVVATNARTFDTGGFLNVSGGNNGVSVNGQINGFFEPTFVPEPSTTLLCGLGFLGVAASRRRGNR